MGQYDGVGESTDKDTPRPLNDSLDLSGPTPSAPVLSNGAGGKVMLSSQMPSSPPSAPPGGNVAPRGYAYPSGTAPPQSNLYAKEPKKDILLARRRSLVDMIGRTRGFCVMLFGIEFIVTTLGLLLVSSCYRYNLFYTIGLPPQFVRLPTSIFCMLVCAIGSAWTCRWAIRTAVASIFFSIFSIIIMSVYVQHYSDAWDDSRSEQYTCQRFLYWGTIALLFYTIFCLIALADLDKALWNRESMNKVQEGSRLLRGDPQEL